MSELNHVNSEISGFGSHSAQEVEKLQKALGLGGQGANFDPGGIGGVPDARPGYSTDVPSAFDGGNALAVEDLDRTLKLVTFGLEHLRLWKDILKERVPQVVHEYNVQNAYGLSDQSPFFQMGNTPVESDAQYNRDVVQIKYLGTKGAVLHNLTLIQAAHGPVVAREVKNKTIELLARNERALFDADSSIMAQEYDGLKLQILAKAGVAAYNSSAFAGFGNAQSDLPIIEANGADLDEDICEDAGLLAVNNFGMPMDMYLGTDIHSAFSRAFYAKQRTVPGDSLTSGNRVKEHMGTLDYRFKPSLFNRPRKTTAAAPGTSGAIDNGITLAAVGTGSDVIAVVVTEAGESGSAALITNSGAVNVSLAIDVSALPANSLYINFYFRPVTTTGDFLFVKRFAIPAADRAAANERIDAESFDIGGIPGSGSRAGAADNVLRVAGTGDAFLIMHDPDVLCWKQLGSMIKYDLAVTTTAYEWLQLLYGTPLVMAPKKNVIVRNLASN